MIAPARRRSFATGQALPPCSARSPRGTAMQRDASTLAGRRAADLQKGAGMPRHKLSSGCEAVCQAAPHRASPNVAPGLVRSAEGGQSRLLALWDADKTTGGAL